MAPEKQGSPYSFLAVVALVAILGLFVFDFRTTALVGGVVRDAATGKPVEGALICVKWPAAWCYGKANASFWTGPACFSVSGEGGRFDIPGVRPWISFGPLYRLKGEEIRVFHPQYNPGLLELPFRRNVPWSKERQGGNIAAAEVLPALVAIEPLKEGMDRANSEILLRHFYAAFDDQGDSYLSKAREQGLSVNWKVNGFLPLWRQLFEPLASEHRVASLWNHLRLRVERAETIGVYGTSNRP